MLTVLSLGAFAYAQNGIYADYDEDSVDLTIDINKVVYISVCDLAENLTGFERKDIRNGFIEWHNIHKVVVDSATDYVLTCNVHTGNSTFTDTETAYFNNISGVNRPWVQGLPIAEGIFKNFTYARATGFDWKRVDTIGAYHEPGGNSPKYQELANGNHTFGTNGDVYKIDFKLDFIDNGDQPEIDENFEMPSGQYTITVNYMVIEK